MLRNTRSNEYAFPLDQPRSQEERSGKSLGTRLPLDLHVMTIFNLLKYAFPIDLVMTWLKFFIRL